MSNIRLPRAKKRCEVSSPLVEYHGYSCYNYSKSVREWSLCFKETLIRLLVHVVPLLCLGCYSLRPLGPLKCVKTLDSVSNYYLQPKQCPLIMKQQQNFEVGWEERLKTNSMWSQHECGITSISALLQDIQSQTIDNIHVVHLCGKGSGRIQSSPWSLWVSNCVT